MPKKSAGAMKALSIAQPWAECIVGKGKNVENRTWNTKFRRWFAVHASASKSADRFEYCAEEYRVKLDPEDVDFGSIVGFAKLVDVITKSEVTGKTKKWFQGDYGFVLEEVIRLKKPIRAKGSLGFWNLKGRALKASLAQLTSSQLKKLTKID